MQQFNLTLSDDDRKIIENESDMLGISMSEFIRLAIWDFATSGKSKALKTTCDVWLGETKHDFNAYRSTGSMLIPKYTYRNETRNQLIEFVGARIEYSEGI